MHPNEEETNIYAYDDYIRKIPFTRAIWRPKGIPSLSNRFPTLPPQRNTDFSIFAPIRPGLPNPFLRRKKGNPFRNKLTITRGRPITTSWGKPKLKPKPKSKPKPKKGKGKPKKKKNQMTPVAPPKGKSNLVYWGIGIAGLLAAALLIKTIRDNKK